LQKSNISALKQKIAAAGYRTLGEYLASLGAHDCKRNRQHEGGFLRTDRQMYREELALIWQRQMQAHAILQNAVGDDGRTVMDEIEAIVFKQRPLKLQAGRVGRCSLEPTRQRARIARLECQRFRYWQDINNLQYFDPYSEKSQPLNASDKQKLAAILEQRPELDFKKLRKVLGFDSTYEFNLENGNKKLKGNTTAIKIRTALTEWDTWDAERQQALVEDLLTIQKKSVLKNRLLQHWQLPVETAVKLCLLDFEPDHANLSLKAVNKLLPFLQQGQIYSDARISAGYGYEKQTVQTVDRLGKPPEIPNPIVQKALHELRRVINALIAEHGKPDAIRIEMARDLEMNTTRYQAFIKQQKTNAKANEEAEKKYQEAAQLNPHLKLSKYPNRDDKIKYRLWLDQNRCCVYSGGQINLSTLFSAEIETDHILPYSESLDDSYMNKVVCYTDENRLKGQRTPMDAFGGDPDKWNQITQRLQRWDKKLKSKKDRFYKTAADLQPDDFINSQLNDTRYIGREAHQYVQQLGVDVSVSKGAITAWLRKQWGLNTLLGTTAEKERTNHRHHTIDAAVTACIDRGFYRTLVGIAKDLERQRSELRMQDLHVDPPWESLREDLHDKLENMLVAHTPQLKLSGALHEETGVGFIENLGCVYRANLDGGFDAKQAKEKGDASLYFTFS
jgi:CRISPR-associated endonuclease Csn1